MVVLKNSQPPSKTSTRARFRGWLVVGNNLILKCVELVKIYEYYPINNIPLWEMGGCTTQSPSFAILLWWLVVVVGRNAQFRVLSWQSPALLSGV